MRADVAVVGAGIAGAVAAAVLAEGGRRVVLLDRGYPGHGATGRSAGFLTSQAWDPRDLTLVQTSRALCQEFLPEGEAGVHRVGFLRVSTDPEDGDRMRARARALEAEGVRVAFLSPRKLRRRFPWMDTAGLVGGLHTPGDGYVDPYDVTAGAVARFKEAGGTLSVNNPATRIRTEDGRVTGVEAREEAVEAPVAVVAAGAWTRGLLGSVDATLALKAYRVQALVTAPLPALEGLPLFHELPGGRYLRPEGPGLLVGDGTEHTEADPEAYDREADFALYTDLAAWLSRRVPAAAAAAVVRGWAGLCVATPDRVPLVGPVGPEGLHVLAGFNGLGVMRAPALGKALADALLGRDPAPDLTPFRPDRFPPDRDFPIREGFTLA